MGSSRAMHAEIAVAEWRWRLFLCECASARPCDRCSARTETRRWAALGRVPTRWESAERGRPPFRRRHLRRACELPPDLRAILLHTATEYRHNLQSLHT